MVIKASGESHCFFKSKTHPFESTISYSSTQVHYVCTSKYITTYAKLILCPVNPLLIHNLRHLIAFRLVAAISQRLPRATVAP